MFEQLADFTQVATSASPAASLALGLLGGVLSLIGIAGLFAQLHYLEQLATRIPDPKIAARAHFLKYAMGISFGIIILIAIIAIVAQSRSTPASGMSGMLVGAGCFILIVAVPLLVFVIMYLNMLNNLARIFREQAQFARQTWAVAC